MTKKNDFSDWKESLWDLTKHICEKKNNINSGYWLLGDWLLFWVLKMGGGQVKNKTCIITLSQLFFSLSKSLHCLEPPCCVQQMWTLSTPQIVWFVYHSSVMMIFSLSGEDCYHGRCLLLEGESNQYSGDVPSDSVAPGSLTADLRAFLNWSFKLKGELL